jgi:hypothetical protein
LVLVVLGDSVATNLSQAKTVLLLRSSTPQMVVAVVEVRILMVRQVAQEGVVVRMLPRLLLLVFLVKATMVVTPQVLLVVVEEALQASAVTLRVQRAVLEVQPPQTVMTA